MPRRTHYPADVLEAISAAVYAAALPSAATSLDPLYSLSMPHNPAPPTASPSTYPAAYWPEPTSRSTLATLCLVSHDFREAARPWLWRRLEINIPRHWLEILDAICGEDEQENSPNSISGMLTENYVKCSRSQAIARTCSGKFKCLPAFSSASGEKTSEEGFDGLSALPVGLGTVPHDLLTPISSRAPSPAGLQLRAASPGRWQFIKALNKLHHSDPGFYGMSLESLLRGPHFGFALSFSRMRNSAHTL